MIKSVKKQKKSQLRYSMVPCTIKNLLPIINILKTLPSSAIDNYMKNLQIQRSRKTAVKELGKMKEDKIVLKKALPVLHL